MGLRVQVLGFSQNLATSYVILKNPEGKGSGTAALMSLTVHCRGKPQVRQIQ